MYRFTVSIHLVAVFGVFPAPAALAKPVRRIVRAPRQVTLAGDGGRGVSRPGAAGTVRAFTNWYTNQCTELDESCPANNRE
jgi:hypothetical protein